MYGKDLLIQSLRFTLFCSKGQKQDQWLGVRGRKGSFFMKKKVSTFPGWRETDMLGNWLERD